MAKGKYHEWLEPDNLLLLEGWKREGLSDEDIAKNMGIATSTLYNWLNKYVEISEALKRGREVSYYIAENAFFKRLTGYTYVETKETQSSSDGAVSKTVTKTKKHIPPDVGALIFYLKNARADKWRDRREYDVNADSMNKLDQVLDRLNETMNEEDDGED